MVGHYSCLVEYGKKDERGEIFSELNGLAMGCGCDNGLRFLDTSFFQFYDSDSSSSFYKKVADKGFVLKFAKIEEEKLPGLLKSLGLSLKGKQIK